MKKCLQKYYISENCVSENSVSLKDACIEILQQTKIYCQMQSVHQNKIMTKKAHAQTKFSYIKNDAY